MSDFIDGKELKAYWGKRGFELFNCLKKGLQPYTPLGHKIADTDTLEHTRDGLSLKQCIARVRAANRPNLVEHPTGFRVYHRYVPRTEKEIERRAKKDYESQPLKPINPPPHHMSFTLPLDVEKTSNVLSIMDLLLFRKDEVNEFAEKHGYPRLESAHIVPSTYQRKEEELPSFLGTTANKLRPNQQDKENCQKIAREIWDKHPILDIVHVIRHPDIRKIVGRQYKDQTIHNWLKVVAPERARKPGRRDMKTKEEQKRICKTLGIK